MRKSVYASFLACWRAWVTHKRSSDNGGDDVAERFNARRHGRRKRALERLLRGTNNPSKRPCRTTEDRQREIDVLTHRVNRGDMGLPPQL